MCLAAGDRVLRILRSLLPGLLIIAVVAGRPGPSIGIELDFKDGLVTGNFDTTVAAGLGMRVSGRNADLIGVSNGGRANSINGDNGNLNYGRWDLTSLNGRVTHELYLRWKNISFFGRGYYFYDVAVMDIGGDRTSFSHSARRRAGWDAELLDYYLIGDFEILERPVTVRLGSQVLNWGESTFIQNGINVINHFDVTQLRVAGAELRDALLPIPAIDVNIGLTDRLSIEAFYQLYWDHTEIEPEGTFFSTSDLASPGGRIVFLGFGQPGVSDNPPPEIGANPPIGTWVPRAPERDRDAGTSGQGGVALRYFSPELNDTEFGLYWIHYNSRLPVLSGRTGTRDAVNIPILDYTSSGQYFREFPEGIHLFGGSFNTEIANTGLALGGEVSYKLNQPLQADDVELLLAALSPIDPLVMAIYPDLKDPKGVFARSQLTPEGVRAGFNQEITGYRRKGVLQPQMTLINLLGPTLGSDQVVMVAEVGATWVPDLESKSELRYEGPGTYTSATPFFTQAELEDRTIQPATQPLGGFADSFSWGYRLAGRADFNNAIGPVNLQPFVAFAHDVEGTTPSPIVNFVEGRKTFTFGVGGDYLNRFRGTIRYTSFFDGFTYNLLKDRDFIELSMSYSF